MIRWLCNYRAGKKRSPASDCVTQAFHINKDRKKLNVNLLPLLSFFLTENNSPKEHQHRKLPRKHSQFATFIKIDCDLSTQLRAPAVMLQIGTLHKKFMRKLQLIEPEQREGERGEVRTWAQQRYQLSAGWMSDSEKSWHAPLRLQNNGCLINTFLALVRFWTAPASCLLKGLATQIWVMCCVENIWTWCDIIPPPPCAGDEKYDSCVENWSTSPNFPAASAWQMTLLSLSWVGQRGARLNPEDNRFMRYRLGDSLEILDGKIAAAPFKTRRG